MHNDDSKYSSQYKPGVDPNSINHRVYLDHSEPETGSAVPSNSLHANMRRYDLLLESKVRMVDSSEKCRWIDIKPVAVRVGFD
jgi:hypothetical protein